MPVADAALFGVNLDVAALQDAAELVRGRAVAVGVGRPEFDLEDVLAAARLAAVNGHDGEPIRPDTFATRLPR